MKKDLLAIHGRRSFLRDCAGGIGMMALGDLLAAEGRAANVADPMLPRKPHFAPKAKNVIFLFMEGAPSQMDLFDPKPELQRWHGKPLPTEMTKDLKLAFIKPTAKVMGSPFKFQKHGQSGLELSELLPQLGTVADDVCMVRSMYSEAFNHHPGQLFLFTGSMLGGRPTMGSWVTYGLGSEARNLPGFVVLSSGVGTSAGSDNWSSGFLPSTYAGTVFRSKGDPILYLSNPKGISRESQRLRLDAMKELNEEHLEATGDAEIASRIHSYELAYRMQMSAPELLDFSKEPAATLDMYGLNKDKTKPFATNCLLARRLVERGVRFVMCMHASWDHHSSLESGLRSQCNATDQPAAALIKDLKQRGMLDDTIVIWGGEFGRTSMSELRRPDDPTNIGRDHHPNGYSMWMAGGGIRGGQTIGKTDDLALSVTEDKVHVHDLQATILHCLGMDHLKLTYRHMGRDYRLTDLGGSVVKKLLA
ncbi:MAG: DUF1501 domain-containing protein [Acidobacteria bacterium]|nr:DUF1501 domain-containing protein [Acidobacteriota bacterium]